MKIACVLTAAFLFMPAASLPAGEKAPDLDAVFDSLCVELEKAKTNPGRFAVIDSIALLGTPAAADYLALLVEGEIVISDIPKKEGKRTWNALRAYALSALAANRMPGAELVVRGALADPAEEVRAAAIAAWSQFPARIDVDRVAAFFNDESPLPQVEAARLLGKINKEKCRKILVSQLENRHPAVRAAVLESLMPWRKGLDLEKIRKPMMKDENTGVRVAAVELTARDADADAVEMLVDAFLFEGPPADSAEPEFPMVNPATVNDAVLDALVRLPADVADAVLVKNKLPLAMKLEPFRRGFVIRAVGKRKTLAAVETLAAILAGDTAENRELAAAALGEIGEPEAEEYLFAYFKDGGFDAKLAALEALAGLKTLTRLDEVISISRIYRWEVKVLALGVLSAHANASTVARLADALSEKPWQMQVAAARALGAAKKKECIEPLVKALETATGRLKIEVLNALWEYTQEVKSESAAQWRSWWKKAKKEYAVPKTPFATRPERLAPKTYSVPTLFGRRLDSERIVLVIDSSAAMFRKTGNSSKKPAKTAIGELASFIRKLPKSVDFNIIAASEKPVQLWPHITRADARAKQAAARFLANVKKSDFAGLDSAIGLALDDPDADTVIIITVTPDRSKQDRNFRNSYDPRCGSHYRVKDFLLSLRRKNRARMVAVSVFSFGGKDNFLESLAAENSGENVLIPFR